MRNSLHPGFLSITFVVIILLVLGLFFLDEYLMQPVFIKPQTDLSLHDYRIHTAKYYEIYRQWTIHDNQLIFSWHLRSTKIIFWVSMLITISGIGFSFWQFIEASRGEKLASEINELEVKTQLVSIAFKSRSLATLIMFIALAYFLIYVGFVYPIKVVPQSAIDPEQNNEITTEAYKDEDHGLENFKSADKFMEREHQN